MATSSTESTLGFFESHERSLFVATLLLTGALGLYLALGPVLNPLALPTIAESIQAPAASVVSTLSPEAPVARNPVEHAKSLHFALTKMTPFLKKNMRQRLDKKLSSPHLQTPPAGTAFDPDQNFVIAWAATLGATGYQIQVADDAGFEHVVSDQRVPENFYATFDSSTAGKYYWRVRSLKDSVESSWSAPSHFAVRGAQAAASRAHEPTRATASSVASGTAMTSAEPAATATTSVTEPVIEEQPAPEQYEQGPLFMF